MVGLYLTHGDFVSIPLAIDVSVKSDDTDFVIYTRTMLSKTCFR